MNYKTMMEATRAMKADSYKMAALSLDTRNNILKSVKDALLKNAAEIFKANATDIAAAETDNIAASVKKRLKFDEVKLKDVVAGIDQLMGLKDPIGHLQLNRQLDQDLILKRVSCPIGVVGIIFEARPDAMVQISSLCIKSGNCAVLKGGKETAHTNKILFDLIYRAAVENGAPDNCLIQAQGHNEIDELLACNKYVDLLIPRGSNSFVQYIMNNTKIPVMGHADGICHTYIDKDADMAKALRIIVDAKTQYTAACNATETLLVDKALGKDKLNQLAKALLDAKVSLHGDAQLQELLAPLAVADMPESSYATEYLDMAISIRLVDGVDEAIDHINSYGSHHTDCIVTENDETAERFMALVDSAGCYLNASTRFADGFRYGFGAEVGISTSKIHARGPVGLEGLTTYKYKLYGNGSIVGEYASGQKQFHFADI